LYSNMSTETLFITKSRIRRELLAALFTAGTDRHYVRELERTLGYSAGNIRRELLRLQADGIINAERLGNLVLYSVNKQHPLYTDLRSIISKTVGVESELRSLLQGFTGISHAFLYGSFAAGKEDKDSDIDLAVVGAIDENKFVSAIRKLEAKLNREINYTLYSLKTFEKERVKEGSFLKIVYDGKILMLKGEKSV